MENIDGGTMTEFIDLINSEEHMNDRENLIKYSLRCIAKGLKDIHAKKIIHRDIKSDNVLFGYSGFKIIDVGISAMLTKT